MIANMAGLFPCLARYAAGGHAVELEGERGGGAGLPRAIGGDA